MVNRQELNMILIWQRNMEKNNCPTYKDYSDNIELGRLDIQIQHRENENSDKHVKFTR